MRRGCCYSCRCLHYVCQGSSWYRLRCARTGAFLLHQSMLILLPVLVSYADIDIDIDIGAGIDIDIGIGAGIGVDVDVGSDFAIDDTGIDDHFYTRWY